MLKFVFAILFGLVALLPQTGIAADSGKPSPAVKCVVGQFVAPRDRGGFSFGWEGLDYTKVGAVSASEKTALSNCLKKTGASNGTFALALPYLSAKSPVKWQIAIVACTLDGGGYIFKGAVSAKENFQVTLKEWVPKTHSLVKTHCKRQ